MKRERPAHRFGNAAHEIPEDNYASVVKRLRLRASNSHLGSSKPHSDSNYGDASPSGCGSPLGQSSSLSFFEFYSMYATPSLEEASISPTESVLLAAEMAPDFFSEASMLYDMLSEVKGSHPDVVAMDELMKRMNSIMQDETRFPRAGLDATSVQMCTVGNVYKGLVRAYVFLYQRFYRAFVALEVEELLAACWQRLLGFSAEHRVLEEEFIQKVYDQVFEKLFRVRQSGVIVAALHGADFDTLPAVAVAEPKAGSMAAICDVVRHLSTVCTAGARDEADVYSLPPNGLEPRSRVAGNSKTGSDRVKVMERTIRLRVPKWRAGQIVPTPYPSMDTLLGLMLMPSSRRDFCASVSYVHPGSAAELLGIQPGAVVASVNGQSLSGLSAQQVEETLRSALVLMPTELARGSYRPGREEFGIAASYDHVTVGFLQRTRTMSRNGGNPFEMTKFPSPQGVHLPVFKDYDDIAGAELQKTHNKEDVARSSSPERRRERSRSMKHFWMSDRSSKACYECEQLFTFFRRRHHCRSCGQIFCSQCCARLPQSFGGTKVDESITRLRKQLVCHTCHRQLREGLEMELVSGGVKLDGVQKPQPSPSSQTLMLMPPHIAEALERSMSEHTHFQHLDKGELFDKDEISDDIRSSEQPEKARAAVLFSMFPKVQIVSSVQHLAHQTGLRGIKDTFENQRGSEQRLRSNSDPLILCGGKETRKEQLLHSFGKLKRASTRADVLNKKNFSVPVEDFQPKVTIGSFPKSPYSIPRPKAHSGTFGDTPSFGSSVNLDPFQAPRSSEIDRLKGFAISQDDKLSARESGVLAVIGLSEDARDNSEDHMAIEEKKKARRIMKEHGRARIEERIFHLLESSPALSRLSIPDVRKWMQIVNSFVRMATKNVTCEPDQGDALDIMEYVHIKTLDGGDVLDSLFIDGVLVHKSLARKGMRHRIPKPRILLIASELDYQRNKDIISSLESVAGQEVEYMHIVTEKIMTLRPDIVMFSGHVHRVAEELLFKDGVVVIKNVRLVDLQRIARCTGASLLTSYDHVDKISARGVIGTCEQFKVMVSDYEPKSGRRYNEKTSDEANGEPIEVIPIHVRKKRPQRQNIVFEGGVKSKGCTLCLRGGSSEVFSEVTSILTVIIRAAYNMRLQRALLLEYGYLPPDEDQIRSVAEEWFAKSSRSLYTSLKSNSLSMRAALKETQSMCKWCKDHTHFNNISSLRAVGVADYNGNLTTSEGAITRTHTSGDCTCNSKSSDRLRDRILFSSCWSTLEGKTASKAEMMCIDFYSANDCSLGQFLERYCFSSSAREFKRAFTASKLSFSHDTVRVTLRVKDLSEFKDQSDRSAPAADVLRDISHRAVLRLVRSDQAIMWSRIVGLEPQLNLSTQYSVVPRDVWNYSFGKFLEDMFYLKSMEIDTVRLSHLSRARGSRDPSFVHYFCRRGRVVSIQCEPLQPVLHVALQPALWRDHIDHEAQLDAINELCDLAREVYVVTTTKIAESMADLVTPLHAKHNLKLLRNEVMLWYSCYAPKMEANPPRDMFAKNMHFKQIYAYAVGWSLRITQAMHATVRPTIKAAEGSPKSALPRAWFDQLAQSESDSALSSFPGEPAHDIPFQESMAGMAGNLENLAKFARSLASRDSTQSNGYENVSNEVTNTLTRGNKRVQMNLTEFADPWSIDEKEDVISLSFPALNGGSSDSGSTYANNLGASTVNSISSSRKALETFRRTYQIKKTDGLGYLTIPKRLLAWHPSLPAGVKGTSVLVNASQPTSVIAYSLCSKEYFKHVNDYIHRETSQSESKNANIHRDSSSKASPSTVANMLQVLRSSTRNNVDHVFIDDNQFQPVTRFSCKSYYAMQFHALRRLYYGGDRNYVESLCHCEQWNAAGGKSGAGFLKTRDQRFIAKAIPEIEVQMFLSMAKEYFCYMAKTFENKLSSMLSKVLGIYKVTISNESEQKMCILVMENLLYGREVSFSFDLKGKMEGRYKERSDESGSVLWDRNFVEMAGGIPLPLQESANSLLLSAFVNDTTFLSSVQATDYSMLVGYDVRKQEVVASIIDYIHKYDFLKMVEHAGKRLIQDEGEITVLNPKHYRKRFCTAMTKYFVSIPSRYTKVTTMSRNMHINSSTAPDEDEQSPPMSSTARTLSVPRQSIG